MTKWLSYILGRVLAVLVIARMVSRRGTRSDESDRIVASVDRASKLLVSAAADLAEAARKLSNDAVRRATESEDLKVPLYRRRSFRDFVIAAAAALVAVAMTAYLDDARADREAAQAERLGWRTTFATESKFENIDLSGTNLSSFYSSQKDFSGANFSRASLARASFTSSDFVGADFSSANLEGGVFTGSALRNVKVDDAILSGVNLSSTDVSGVDFAKARDAEGMRTDGICYNYATIWPGDAPPLNWRTCWTGFSGEVHPRGPGNYSCSYRDPSVLYDTTHLWFRSLTPSREEGCDYFAYLQGSGVSGSTSDYAFAASFVCDELRQGGSIESALSRANASSSSGTSKREENERKTLVFGAAYYLCHDAFPQVRNELR